MIVIECPHCSEDIEMDDDAYGLFECPICEGEYEWGEAPKKKKKKTTKSDFKTRSKSKTRTRPKNSAQKERTNRNSNPTNNPAYGKVQVAIFLGSIFLTIMIISGLGSNSWYTYSGEAPDGAEVSAGYGLSNTIMTVTYEGYGTSDSLTYTQGSLNDYESRENIAEEQQKGLEEGCSDGTWGYDEEYCGEEKSSVKDSIEYWSGWNSAGNFLFYSLLFFLLCSIGLVVLKSISFMENYGMIELSSEFYNNKQKIDNIASTVIYSLLILALLMFLLFIPSLELIYSDNFLDEVSSGMGFSWWIIMITCITCLVLSMIELTKRKSAY